MHPTPQSPMPGCIDALKTAAERSLAVFDQETHQRLMAQLLVCDEQVRGRQRALANEPACVLPAAPQQPLRRRCLLPRCAAATTSRARCARL